MSTGGIDSTRWILARLVPGAAAMDWWIGTRSSAEILSPVSNSRSCVTAIVPSIMFSAGTIPTGARPPRTASNTAGMVRS